jgi:hypothetical protein
MQSKTVSKTKRVQAKQRKEISFPLDKTNFMILGIGIIVLFIGYILMSENSVDGFLPTVIAPILLVLGYCVIIPYGIMKKSKSDVISEPITTTSQSTTAKVSSNIKTK